MKNFNSVTWFFTQKPSKKVWKNVFFENFTLKNKFSEKKNYMVFCAFKSSTKWPKPILKIFDSFWVMIEKLQKIFFTKTVLRGSLWVGSWPNTKQTKIQVKDYMVIKFHQNRLVTLGVINVERASWPAGPAGSKFFFQISIS